MSIIRHASNIDIQMLSDKSSQLVDIKAFISSCGVSLAQAANDHNDAPDSLSAANIRSQKGRHNVKELKDFKTVARTARLRSVPFYLRSEFTSRGLSLPAHVAR